jgi:hypothetical protein
MRPVGPQANPLGKHSSLGRPLHLTAGRDPSLAPRPPRLFARPPTDRPRTRRQRAGDLRSLLVCAGMSDRHHLTRIRQLAAL